MGVRHHLSHPSSPLQAGLPFASICIVGAYSICVKIRALGVPVFTAPLWHWHVLQNDHCHWCGNEMLNECCSPKKTTQLVNFKQLYVFLVNVMELKQVNVSNRSKRLKQSCKCIISAGRFPVLCSQSCCQAPIYKISCMLI